MSFALNHGIYRSNPLSGVLEQKVSAPMPPPAGDSVAAEVDAWHKRACRCVDDARSALRARRDAMNRLSQERHRELERADCREPSEEDALLAAEAQRLERSSRQKMDQARSHVEAARATVSHANQESAAGAAQPRFDSHDEFYDMIVALLGELDAEWLGKYEDLLANYIAFFNDLTKALAKLSDAIKGTDDDGNFDVDFSEAQKALQEVYDKYKDFALVDGFASKEAAEAFLADLGVQGLKVERSGSGWKLVVDVALVEEIKDVLKSDPEMDPAEYNAIIAAKDSRVERLSQINNLLAEKYQRQNQQWDTLAKVLSNTIKEMDEAQRSFVNGL